ncbi:RanGTP-binding protein-domain-containing protein [Aspergillus pseudonomiae]|uniref:RanGTP-binding protein-domain-containing protein n=1 Tax=Aspergillus pseudonomiae TaxID=1506151 RepID=A0A5N6I7M8_9EURO|nr:RanGTP-binding protein-domain-containing protein [Aspergillus pseudonomiae]KAB8262675.1 RanGTP-binding protein-domain-containing protein [Aspergillus pseudonomiae]KAE8409596.1 RanGTP-binding protein-domain-containing protein [Aspergillus pseudonomiae]
MDAFLTRLTHQAMNYAIRSGIAITAKYAIRQSSRLLKNVENVEEREELLVLQQRLESKIQVISPAIDMIELIAARGNTSLESAVSLTQSLRWDIQALGQRLANAAASEEIIRKEGQSSRSRSQNDEEIKSIMKDIRRLLVRIEDAVPLMNLAITTSGAKLSTNLPATISPSRLLQASTFLTAGDTQYSMSPSQAVQIGPTFTLSMYMLFASHLRPHDEDGIRETTWKEVMHKARLKLRRVPMDLAVNPQTQLPRTQIAAEARVDEYAYQLLIIEDLDDGRVHTFEDDELQPQTFEGVVSAGVREILPIHQISKIFYADTGKILNISPDGEVNNPVILLKRDINAIPPRRMVEREEAFGYSNEDSDQDEEEVDEVQAQLDAQLNGAGAPSTYPNFHESSIPEEWRLPRDLDPEWIAFEVYNEDDESDSEFDDENPRSSAKAGSIDPELMAKLSLDSDATPSRHGALGQSPSSQHMATTTVSNPHFNNIRTSLSLLETLLRLTSLQQFQQQSHLSISDELLNFFLEESSTTGAGGDEQHRQRLRADARRRVGWDPYDESPMKRRGEDYQYGWVPEGTPSAYPREGSEFPYSPSERLRGFQLRSREHTPETPPRSRRDTPRQPDMRQHSTLRSTPAYMDRSSRKNSPLPNRSTPEDSERVGHESSEEKP